MENYQKLYARMVDASERAISEIEQQNYGAAREILIAAERECEEIYISAPQQRQQGQSLPCVKKNRRSEQHIKGSPV